MSLLSSTEGRFEFELDVAVAGAGACGLTAGLAAAAHDRSVMVFERDPTPLGTTAMSTGLIPAAGTRFQRASGIEDSPELFAEDIMRKTGGATDRDIALALARESAATVEWLVDSHRVPLSLVDSFLYPGHSVMRMHGTPKRTGRELMGALCNAADHAALEILCEARVSGLFAAEDGRVTGLRLTRPDGAIEHVGCRTLILACCGFAGNPEMVGEFMPEIAGGVFHGHPGNQGDAIIWGQELGAAVADMSAYQGHGGLAKDRGVPILWPVIMRGGIQINSEGSRFSNEARGYSEQAADVLAQPGGIAWTVYDRERHEMMKEFEDYHDALEAGAVSCADDLESLARDVIGTEVETLRDTLEEIARARETGKPDRFGRDFSSVAPLEPPFYAAKVTGALFHTQGGLVVDRRARVLRPDGTPLPNLFAGGGAARGISGPGASGYMAGNGLLTATVFGRLAGETAAEMTG